MESDSSQKYKGFLLNDFCFYPRSSLNPLRPYTSIKNMKSLYKINGPSDSFFTDFRQMWKLSLLVKYILQGLSVLMPRLFRINLIKLWNFLIKSEFRLIFLQIKIKGQSDISFLLLPKLYLELDVANDKRLNSGEHIRAS